MGLFDDTYYVFLHIAILVSAFVLTVAAERFLIPVLKSKKMGQKILDIGPRWHKNKEGTPTAGGIGFLSAATVVFVVVIIVCGDRIDNKSALICTYVMAVLSGLIGLVDDIVKFRHKQNEGFKAWQKFALQVILACAYVIVMSLFKNIDTTMFFPFFNARIDLGFIYYPIAVILIVGIMNSVNLNDGIDGLCSSITAIVGLFFSVAAVIISSCSGMIIGSITTGCSLGFLVYNIYPARVFMGDTGSLFFGGIVVGSAFLIGNPLIVLLCGFVYVFETVSVMIQVSYFKLTKGKRFFKMAPFHHHLEKCGWGENRIVAVFCMVTLVLCILSVFGLERV